MKYVRYAAEFKAEAVKQVTERSFIPTKEPSLAAMTSHAGNKDNLRIKQ